MAQYTILNDIDVQTILSHYGSEIVVSYQVLSGGSENTNYLVNTSTKSYVLTICEQKSHKETEQLALLLEYLNDHNFATSKVVKTKNNLLTYIWSDKPIMLKEFIEGEIVEDLSKELLIYLGRELAKLHQIKPLGYLPKTVSYGLERFDEVIVYAPESSFYTWLKETQAFIETYIQTDLPKSLIHSDIFYNNIIVDKNEKQATIMDFEEACYYYRVFDIGMMIIGTCSKDNTLDLEKVSNLLKGYQQEITLLDIEIEVLKVFTVYGATATAFWRHQNFNYVQVNKEMANHYMAMQELATHVIAISDEKFKKCFALE
ncbi:homoserine kinase [Dokdonia sp.]|uniref:homoserine kinase n=1 Tax=Dokdonia sp. TaxID=2024995 RepID=UPI003262EE5A